ncbi:MAG: hypothetical protein Rubg2KO_36520 [Rubricoccaceae bacterium]
MNHRTGFTPDIFSGSNTTGWVAQKEERRWLSFENRLDYVAASAFRFVPNGLDESALNDVYCRITSGETVDLEAYKHQTTLFD